MNREYALYRSADVVSRYLPRRFAYWLSLRIADRFYSRDAVGRNAVMANLRRVMEYGGMRPSEEKLWRMARQTFQYFGKHTVDFFRFGEMSRGQVNRLVNIERLNHLDEGSSLGKGVIIVTAHLGSWEIGGALLASLGYAFNAVVLPQRLKKLNELFEHRREKRGIRCIPLNRAVPDTLAALGRRECVALLADRDYSLRKDFASLFGAPARLPRGPALLSIRSGAPVVCGFVLRQQDDNFLLRFHPPIVPGKGLDGGESVQRQICSILEKEIERNPVQWFMFEKVWKD